ncbi:MULTISPECIES: carbohydrate kinase family protein [Haloprofundus]|uniref:carbohydrate kinase family protein n=1 Tax=Haloprofundus TaxID=1911573 RepID=UPI000E44C000|nr:MULTISPECIES: PfkB family carbohydrate kinase [Haloprofundus]QCJ46126.1 carbohydrate kinase family protein [Haloprofundus sp. MHR1]
MPRVICAGHVNWDVTLRVDQLPEPDGEAAIEAQSGAGGGSAANVAGGLAGLGVATDIFGSVGDDGHGAEVEAELADAGVDCETLVRTEGPTAVKYLVVAADGRVMVLGRDGVNEAFSATDLAPERLAAADHLHLTSHDPETAATLVDRAHSVGVPVSFDPGRRVGDRGFEGALDGADIVFLNDREAAAALDADLSPNGRTLVLKHGPRGAEVRTPTETYTHPGFAVDTVDTTGAGDAFAAGFLASRLDGDGYDRALAVANACGALAASSSGARTALDWGTVGRLLDD